MEVEYQRLHETGHYDWFSGLLGGVASVIVGHPFDTLKVRLQTSSTSLRSNLQALRHESVRGYYKGVTSPLVGQGAINAILFTVQHGVTERMGTRGSLATECFGGFVAGISQCVVCTPMELVRIKMQNQGIGEAYGEYRKHRPYKSPLDCAARICRKEGIRGLYRGNTMTMMREGPSFAMYFASFEMFSYLLSGWEKDKDKRSALVVFMAGGFAGQVCWLCTYPIDVVKTHLQDQSAHSQKYKSSLDCMRALWLQGGLRPFFRGLGVTLIRAFPVNATTFCVEEHALYYLKKFFRRQ